MKRFALALLVSALLAGCWGFAHDEHVVGPYRLIAVDTKDQMSLSYSLSTGDAVGRIQETVFSVGANEEYLVAKRHPNDNRAITEFYYIIRSEDSEYASPTKSVRGPFSEVEFQAKKEELRLPDFSRTIDSLK